ncbi:MAG: peptidase dimerization domain-containing protein, partial [Paracoccus sp. (in: a-proteobacteria)]|nr:peptidase dimerization domain-containing protein [Paracoccus sp. (in: a-proteobacteria)]
YGFAIHNYPGLAPGHALIGKGAMNCASVGMRAGFRGATAHASEPEKARTPARAIAAIIPALLALSQGATEDADFRLVTITHLNMGAPAFGITPGEAEIRATLRCQQDHAMNALREAAMHIVGDHAKADDLGVEIDWQDDFAASVNHPEAAAIMARAARATGITVSDRGLPMRASEDFGRFAARGKTAMILLGAGEDHPPLHAADYDFPDQLIAPSARLFDRITRDLTG